MSNYKGHIIGAFFLDIILLVLGYFIADYFKLDFFGFFKHNYLYLVSLLFISIIFSLFPDIDTNSFARHTFYILFFIIDLILIFYLKKYRLSAIFGLLLMLPAISKHRGFTHSKTVALLICTLAFIILPSIVYKKIYLNYINYFFAALIGYFSHLLIDGELFKKKW